MANDKADPNSLYLNNGNGTFSDISTFSGTDIVIDAMCVAFGDFDNDDDFDIYVTNTPAGNALLQNNGGLTFSEVAADYGVTYNQVGWGSNFFDFDNDRDLDLYVSGANPSTTYMPSALYRNDVDSFKLLAYAMTGDTTSSYSQAIGDYNGDGALDIAVQNEAPFNFQLWESAGASGNWIKLDLDGVTSNRNGIGSLIELYSGGQKQIRQTHCGIGYLAQNSDYPHFGIGNQNDIDSIKIHWPSGMVDVLFNPCINTMIKVEEGGVTSSTSVSITPDGPTEFCSGGSVNLNAGIHDSYLWSTGDTTQSITVASSGNYSVSVSDNGGLAQKMQALL